MDFLKNKKTQHPDGTDSHHVLSVLERERALLDGTEQLSPPAPQHWHREKKGNLVTLPQPGCLC